MDEITASVRRERLVAALARVAQGEQSGLQEIYRATSAKLFGVCLRICQDREGAEDVLQQVYIKVWDRAGRFEAARGSPITWLCAIARNTALDWRRANHIQLLPESAAEAVADGAPLAWEAIAFAQESARIVACLDALDERPRRAIHAAFFDGLTYLQLSQAMEVPLGTLKSWVRRGLLQLKGCLGHD
ncbi:sigma-70 family RNA polymerase sigma factor [Novosphingobium sp. 9U]|uniref:sigma-70 family RNA polymerase sigma factor n=1 Tax=Novosphingobium sp. 9U TaxID=2653158 RepID=UPI0012F4362F|nr:sigma-70 family RNA polymerase sigma factor [Novosphingobium sp. 9U]VWX50754.1 RNA polymerase sigma factor [Novosphingobium sp. 9U]